MAQKSMACIKLACSVICNMIKVLSEILMNILTARYKPFGFSLLLSFLAMLFYLYAYEPISAGRDWKNA